MKNYSALQDSDSFILQMLSNYFEVGTFHAKMKQFVGDLESICQ